MINRDAIESALEEPEKFKTLVNAYTQLREKKIPLNENFFHEYRMHFSSVFSQEFPPSFHSKWFTCNKAFVESVNLVHFAALQGWDEWITEYSRLPYYLHAFNAYTSISVSIPTSEKFIGYGNTPLIFAIRGNRTKVVSALISNGADINQPALFNNQKLAPICYAFFKSRFKIAARLMKAGCNLNLDPDGKLLECIIIGITNAYNKRFEHIPMPDTLSKSHLNLLNQLINAGINLNFSKKQPILVNAVTLPPLLKFFLESGKITFATKKALYEAAKQKNLDASLMIVMHYLSLEEIIHLKPNSFFVKNQLITAVTILLQVKNLLKQVKPISDEQIMRAFDKLKAALPHSIINQVEAQQVIAEFIGAITKTACIVLIQEELQNLVNCIPIMQERTILLVKIGQALADNHMHEKALYFLTQIPDVDEKSPDVGLRKGAQVLANNIYDVMKGEESPILLSLTQIREQLAIASTNKILEEFFEIPRVSSSGSNYEPSTSTARPQPSTSGSISRIGMYSPSLNRRVRSQFDTKESDNSFEAKVFGL